MSCVLSLLAFIVACKGGTRNINGVTIDEDIARIFLAKHNELRAQTAKGLTPNQPSSTYMNNLKWDYALAAAAQVHSATCPGGVSHSYNRHITINNYYDSYKSWEWDTSQYGLAYQTVGENVDWQPLNGATLTPELVASWVERDWFDEYKDYTFNTDYCTSQCGHYTQIVWADTRYVGCGYTHCSGNWVHLVCQYYPGGNYYNRYSSVGRGTQPYYSGPQCSQCNTYASDRTGCSNGMCDGCMAPKWDMCNDYWTNCNSLSCPSTSCSVNPSQSLCNNCRKKCGGCSTADLTAPNTCSADGITDSTVTGSPSIKPSEAPTTSPTVPMPTESPTQSPTMYSVLSQLNDPDCEFGIYNVAGKNDADINGWVLMTETDYNNPKIYRLLVNEYNNNNGIKCLQTYFYNSCCMAIDERLFLLRNNDYFTAHNINEQCDDECVLNERVTFGNYFTNVYSSLSYNDVYTKYVDNGCGGASHKVHPAIYAKCQESATATGSPEVSPTNAPSKSPSSSPMKSPTSAPSVSPSISPTVPLTETNAPSLAPSVSPTKSGSGPDGTAPPSLKPTEAPTLNPAMTDELNNLIEPVCEFGIYNVAGKNDADMMNNNWVLMTEEDYNNPTIYPLLVNEYNNNTGIKCLHTFIYNDCCVAIDERLFIKRNTDYFVTHNEFEQCDDECVLNERITFGNFFTNVYETLSDNDVYTSYIDNGCGGSTWISHPAIYAKCREANATTKKPFFEPPNVSRASNVLNIVYLAFILCACIILNL